MVLLTCVWEVFFLNTIPDTVLPAIFFYLNQTVRVYIISSDNLTCNQNKITAVKFTWQSSRSSYFILNNHPCFQTAGASNEKQSEQITEDSPTQCGQKRQRSDDNASGEATTNLQGQLVEILDRSSQMVAAQLEAQNVNSRLNREQRKDQVSSLLGVLGKVADALYRIADEL